MHSRVMIRVQIAVAKRYLRTQTGAQRSRHHDGNMYLKEHYKRMIGNREQVGFGTNGQPAYFDCTAFPFPAIRYREPTTELRALWEKQKGDWRLLSIEEKKALYRADFRLTFAEFTAPTGEWKTILGGSMLLIAISLWTFVIINYAVYAEVPVPSSFTYDAYLAQLRRMIDQRTNSVQGISSGWDYDKCDWKNPNKLFQYPNPFIDPCTGERVTNAYKW